MVWMAADGRLGRWEAYYSARRRLKVAWTRLQAQEYNRAYCAAMPAWRPAAAGMGGAGMRAAVLTVGYG